MGQSRSRLEGEDYDLTPDIQEYFTKTNLTTKPLKNEDKPTVYDILEKTGFYSITHKGLNSARMKDTMNDLPKPIEKIRNPPLSLPPFVNE